MIIKKKNGTPKPVSRPKPAPTGNPGTRDSTPKPRTQK